MLIYKILLPAEWDQFQAAGRFDGSPVDHRDGFIHLSSRQQVGRTAKRYFADAPALVVVAVDGDARGVDVRWEAASDGDRFPHVYGSLPISAVVATYRVSGAARVDEALQVE
jgi:uncharacterized protein (DUF952 family)